MPKGEADVIVLELAISQGDPPVGSLRRAGDDPATPFDGWIALMAAITEACRSTVRNPADPV